MAEKFSAVESVHESTLCATCYSQTFVAIVFELVAQTKQTKNILNLWQIFSLLVCLSLHRCSVVHSRL